ncbi:hypothetical protein D3C73_1227810 [compost metagenome]
MGDINKPTAMGINKTAFFCAEPDNIRHGTQRTIVIMMATQRIQGQDVANLVNRNRDPNRTDVKIIAKRTART